MQAAASPDREPEASQAKTLQATAPPRSEFPDRQSVEALDRLAGTIPVDIGKHAATITLPSDDYFDVGGAKLTDSARWRLDGIARALAAQSGRTIVVRVYTDALGDRSESLRLSQDRAAALRDYLTLKGVRTDVLRAEGMGPEHPVADNATAAGRASNRRIEVVIER
jgi:outer membrane protein OmpA-like peptidoglycan-associated protein